MKIALICIAKDEDHYIAEWLKYHTKLGFDEVFVYENSWRYQFKDTFEDDPVHFIPLDGKVMQLKAYNMFLRHFGNSFDWAAFIDVDEFIVNHSSTSLKEQLETRSQTPQLALNWRLMGSNGLHEGDTWTRSVLSRFTMGGKKLNHHVKQLVNLKFFKEAGIPFPTFINPHCTSHWAESVLGKKFFGPFQEEDLEQVQSLELFHYAVKTPEELHEKVMRGRADTVQTREAEEMEYFREHDLNEMEFTEARDFMEKTDEEVKQIKKRGNSK